MPNTYSVTWMIDFTDCPRNRFGSYNGANGHKISVVCGGHDYILKFPPRIGGGGYANSCCSEHIGCRILRSIGLEAQ